MSKSSTEAKKSSNKKKPDTLSPDKGEAATAAWTSQATAESETESSFSPENEIFIKGARVNNLKNVDVRIPKNKLVVVTGLSGSGKSSITMDTLFAEGQRRYVESLSSYARQFLGRMKKPDVDFIKGVCPAIAIEQKTSTANARSTVGTLTEVYDYMRVLYARVGKTISPVSGLEVKKHQVSDVVDFILSHPEGTRIQLFIPLPIRYKDRTLKQELDLLLQKGFTRLLQPNGELTRIQDLVDAGDALLDKKLDELRDSNLYILIDRFMSSSEDVENAKRIADSVGTAFYEGGGECRVQAGDDKIADYNNRFELDGIEFVEPTPQLFNFNNPFGACPTCEGFSLTMGIDIDKVVPDKRKSVYEGAIACWQGEKHGEWQQAFLKVAHHFDFPVHRSYYHLTKAEQRLLWQGNAWFQGIAAFFQELEAQLYKIQNRVMLARYRGKTTCNTCEGSRLRKEASYVKIHGMAIQELVDMSIQDLRQWFSGVTWSEQDKKIGARLLLEINNRLQFMCDLGLTYLTLNRLSNTLSGGETQRINLTRILGSNLTSSMYILDEPSVGLHPRDTSKLVGVLKSLRDLGNTVVVVEHEEDVIKNADYLVDIGPEAGVFGGEVVFAGPYERIHEEANTSLTAQYMSGRMRIEIPEKRPTPTEFITIQDASENNLKNISVRIPLNRFSVVTGVSGSGKTSLVRQILYPALKKELEDNTVKVPGTFDTLSGAVKKLSQVEMINQNPIGKSSRSNPVTYVKAYDSIREMMAAQPLSKVRDYQPRHFSFNVDGGRCDTCKGEGEQIIEMQFLADVHLECETCRGKRFKSEVLEVTYRGKSIADILELSVDEAVAFFADHKDILSKIQPLQNVGLGYVQLGQSSSSLSGGEAQRVKLASFLTRENTQGKIFFIFDEPTTGLHFHDIRKLLDALQALVDRGHTVLVVEHNLEVIKCADWVTDLGPDGGENGGHLLYEGPVEGLPAVSDSFTGQYLKDKLT